MWSNQICAWCNVCVIINGDALALNLQTAVNVYPQYPVLLNIIIFLLWIHEMDVLCVMHRNLQVLEVFFFKTYVFVTSK